MLEIMQQIPNTNLADIQKLDEKILFGSQSKGNKIDKCKKDLFKKITAQVRFRVRFVSAHSLLQLYVCPITCDTHFECSDCFVGDCANY